MGDQFVPLQQRIAEYAARQLVDKTLRASSPTKNEEAFFDSYTLYIKRKRKKLQFISRLLPMVQYHVPFRVADSYQGRLRKREFMVWLRKEHRVIHGVGTKGIEDIRKLLGLRPLRKKYSEGTLRMAITILRTAGYTVEEP